MTNDRVINPKTNQLSKQAKELFKYWLTETYTQEDINQIGGNQLTPAGEIYQYWLKWVWKPAHDFTWDDNYQDYRWVGRGEEPQPPEPNADVPTATSTTESATQAFKSPLPDTININGEQVPVNYLKYDSRGEKFKEPLEKDYLTKEEYDNAYKEWANSADNVREVNIYIPIPDIEYLNEESINQIYNNTYGVYGDTGELYNSGNPFTPEWLNLQGIVNYDVIKGKPDLDDLSSAVGRESMITWAKNRYGALTPDMEKYFAGKADMWVKGSRMTPEAMDTEFGNQFGQVEKKPTGVQNEAVNAQEMKRYAGMAESAPQQEGYKTEADLLKATLDYYQKTYDEAQGLRKQYPDTIPSNIGDQYKMGLANYYDLTKKRYDEIQSGQQDNQIFGIDNSKDVNALAAKYDVTNVPYLDTARRYIDKPDSPEFEPLTIEAKQDLAKAANVSGYLAAPYVDNSAEIARKKQEDEFRRLAERARLATATPQRKVRI